MRRFRPSRFDKWRFRLEQMTLQKRLVVAYILIMLLPSVLISLYVFRGFTSNTIEELKKNSRNSLEIEQVHIKNNMETMIRAAQIATNDKVREYLEQSVELTALELIDIDNIRMKDILRLQYNNPSLDDIRIYMSNPKTYEISPVFFYEKRIQQDPWFPVVMNAGETNVWNFSREKRELLQARSDPKNDHIPRISLYRGIEYPKGSHVGIVQVDMQLASFFPNTFSPLQDDKSQLVVLDQAGAIYRYPGESFLDRAGLTEETLKQQVSSIRTTEGGTGNFDFSVSGKPYLVVYSYIEPLQAYMVKLVSLDHVYEEINRTRNWILLANVILLAILTLSTYFMNAIILKKLHVLTDSVKKVRQGDFNFDVGIRGGGEVGELAHHFRKMLRKMGELIAEAVNKQAAAKEAELATLKNQIDSHFLYNTLENIKMMAEVHDHREISDALTSLGSMMRYNMRWTKEHVRLRDEINHISNYVNIANVRFEDKVTLVTDIPDDALDQELLKMSLQPIVENSVKHGLLNRPLTIEIRAEASGGVMMISVTDDGAGMTDDQAEELNRRIGRAERWVAPAPDGDETPGKGNGIGLANVHSRIQMHYGNEYGLQIDSAEGRYTRVTIRIPYFIVVGRLSGHEDAADRG
ncbi:sensor histidine kinase [Cohnella endophytica]|uniref:histidine kinase n=1 Tax=Cohnella endophytica TaxID=2419778 RepID=A0A494X7L4_9BACL|nr:sensor histidine kinase [Cohnella endophytica]RKP46697.1 sensor histidine kinase [Cohnella endophytica]